MYLPVRKHNVSADSLAVLLALIAACVQVGLVAAVGFATPCHICCASTLHSEPNCLSCCGCCRKPHMQVTLVAPWLPPSSRPPGFGGLLALLGGWTPLPLLQAFVGFTNSRVVAQVGAPVHDMTRFVGEVS